MKKIVTIVVGLILFITNVYAQETTVSMNDSVAKVNGESITRGELERATMILIPKTYFHASVSGDKKKDVEKKALEELIEKKLLLQQAKKMGLKVTRDEIENQAKAIAKSFKNKKDFQAALLKASFDIKSFEKAIEEDILMKKFYEKEIKATISEKELKEYYDNNLFKFKEPEKIKVRMIYVKDDPTDPKGKEKAKKKIQEAYAKIKAGEKFADIAAKYSDAMSRIKGGDIGFTHKGRLDPIIDDVAFALKKGEMSEIVGNDKGFYLAFVEDKKPQRLIPFEATKDRLKKSLIAKTENKRKKIWLEKLKKNAMIQR